jgi:hypothetical protein
MKIEGTIKSDGVNSSGLEAELIELRIIDQDQCACVIQLKRPIEKEVEIFGVNESNAVGNAMIFLYNLVKR